MKHFLTCMVFLLGYSVGANAQVYVTDPVDWDIKISKTKKKDEYIVKAKAKIDAGWHLFGKDPGDDLLIPTQFEFEGKNLKLVGVQEVGKLKTEKFPAVGTIHYYENEVSFKALVRSMDKHIKGLIYFQVCNDKMCLPPKEEKFSFTVK